MSNIITGDDVPKLPPGVLNNNLPRDVLKWIQALDLAYSVKNIKRDFSNGFLVAEIISRYYSKDISMHSYDNGMSAKGKRDNWILLVKLLRKLGHGDLVTEMEAHHIATLEDGAACIFICRLYEALTKKKLATMTKKPTIGREPGYAKDIALTKARKAIQHNNLGENSDIETINKVVSAAMVHHERSLQEERVADPQRFSTQSVTKSSQSAPKASTDIDDENMPQVQIKEIQVKQLDRNVTHLRASKQQVSPGGNRSTTRNSNTSAPISNNDFIESGPPLQPASEMYAQQQMISRQNPGHMIPENASSVLNACISRYLNPDSFPQWRISHDPYQNYLSALTFMHSDGDEMDELVAASLEEIRSSAHILAEACIFTPKQFWKIADLICSTINTVSHSSLSFNAAISAFQQIGKQIVSRDASQALPLFVDFALVKLVKTLEKNQLKRPGIVTTLYAFSPQEAGAHIQCIKRLQSLVDDLNVFIHCLTILSNYETVLDDSLLDLYLYYASIALAAPSVKLRAGAVSVYANLTPHATDAIAAVMDDVVKSAKTETWWEVQVYLLLLCANIMEYCNIPATISTAVDIIDIVSAKAGSSRNVAMWAIHVLATATYIGEPLMGTYINILHRLDSSDREFLLGLSGMSSARSIPLPSSSGIPLVVRPVCDRWSSLQVVSSIETTVKTALDKESLSIEQMQIIYACVKCEVELRNQLTGNWVDVYMNLKDYIFVGLCDADNAFSAVGILKCYLLNSKLKETVLQEARFIGALRLLYPSSFEAANTECQKIVEGFLRDSFSAGAPFNSAVVAVVTNFSKTYTANFERSISLQKLLKEAKLQLR